MIDSDVLARLQDEAAVRDATARFADAATRGDSGAFGALWAPRARWRIGDPVDAEGPDDIVAAFRQLREDRDFFVQFALSRPGFSGGSERTPRR